MAGATPTGPGGASGTSYSLFLEVEIAKRIERGKNAMLRAISRTNMAAQEVARLGERLGAREIGVRDAVVFIEEEVTEEKLEAKIKETLKLIGKANQAH